MLIDGDYRVPLFFIEGTMNLAGYFFIRYFLGKVCKFRIGLGYQAASYIAWYGMVRVVLEPLRNGEFEYGQSWYVAFGMLGVGLLGILGFYILHRIRMEKGLEDENGDKIKTAENS
jgi:phosphatidylglycerol:prolipoprotein diacylglycerol transferase